MSDKTKYNGMFLSIVLQTNDPEKRGRVKVYVPHVSATLYTQINKTNQDMTFTFPGLDNPDLENIMDDLKDVLPWAEYAGPIFGGNASGRYNAFTKKGTVSDSNVWENGTLKESGRQLQNFAGSFNYPDAFNQTNGNFNRYVNPYAHAYTPSDYSNLAKGVFSIPNVGSHVWVWFIEGDPQYPVYFAASYSQMDFKRIYTQNKNIDVNGTVDYPGAYENKSERDGGSLNSDGKTFRAKHVINSNKHTIEMVDTDLREILKLTHFSGSFLEFTNFATIQLATNNDQKMVVGDQFLTVRRRQNTYIAQDQDFILGGTQYTTIGNVASDTVNQIYAIMKEIHDIKMLFDIQRAQIGEPPNRVSTKQARVGQFIECPVCLGEAPVPEEGSYIMVPNFVYKPAPNGVGEYIMVETPMPELPESLFQIGMYKGAPCDVCNRLDWPDGYVYPHTPGLSPSTYMGTWNAEPYKQFSSLDAFMVEKVGQMIELEKKLGNGGDQVINIHKNKIETIGLIMNTLQSYRIDPIGKLKIDGCHVATELTYETFKTSPHIEKVSVDDIPGGDYNLTVGNKYALLVGSKGISIKTLGNMDIYGSIVTFSGEQVNITSENEVVIDGGQRLSLRAQKIALMPVEHNPVVVEGQLHVTRNSILQGGVMFEGELGVLHITTPGQWYETLPGGFPPHVHMFKMVPATLTTSQEEVRAKMALLGINSTTSIAAALPIGGIGAGYDGNVFNLIKIGVDRAIETYVNNCDSEHGFSSSKLNYSSNSVNMVNSGESSTGVGKEVKYILTYQYDVDEIKATVTVKYGEGFLENPLSPEGYEFSDVDIQSSACDSSNGPYNFISGAKV